MIKDSWETSTTNVAHLACSDAKSLTSARLKLKKTSEFETCCVIRSSNQVRDMAMSYPMRMD